MLFPPKTMTRRLSERRGGRARRGMTLIETSIVMGTMTLVSAAVMALMVTSGKTLKRVMTFTSSQQDALMAVDQVRYKACMAQFGSISIMQQGHEIQFIDPNNGPAVTSSFKFQNDHLYYDDDIVSGDGFRKMAGPLTDLRFYVAGVGDVVGIVAKAEGLDRNNESRPIECEMRVYVRN